MSDDIDESLRLLRNAINYMQCPTMGHSGGNPLNTVWKTSEWSARYALELEIQNARTAAKAFNELVDFLGLDANLKLSEPMEGYVTVPREASRERRDKNG